jgi:hypothetical protein
VEKCAKKKKKLISSLNIFGDGLILLFYLFYTLSNVFLLKSLKILKRYKIITLRRMDLPSTSGKRAGGGNYCVPSRGASYSRSVNLHSFIDVLKLLRLKK